MKNLNYIVATLTTTSRKVDTSLEVVTNRTTTYPICITRWMSEANGIAMTMAAAWQDTDTGDRVEYVVIDRVTQSVLFRHSTCQTGEPKPVMVGGKDIEWVDCDPFDGVPADTELLARDTF